MLKLILKCSYCGAKLPMSGHPKHRPAHILRHLAASWDWRIIGSTDICPECWENGRRDQVPVKVYGDIRHLYNKQLEGGEGMSAEDIAKLENQLKVSRQETQNRNHLAKQRLQKIKDLSDVRDVYKADLIEMNEKYDDLRENLDRVESTCIRHCEDAGMDVVGTSAIEMVSKLSERHIYLGEQALEENYCNGCSYKLLLIDFDVKERAYLARIKELEGK